MSRPARPLALQPHYTTRDAARIIGCTSAALRNMRCANKGPRWIVTADNTIRYPESALREWLSGGTSGEAA